MSLNEPTTASITRRRFLAAAGVAAVAAKALALQTSLSPAPRFAYTASSGELRIYSTQTTPWTHLQSLPSEAPVSLAIDAHTHTLHVLHDVVEYQGLPRGYIESFRINPRTGRLTRLHLQPLSLSAIHPRHMVLAPDGKTLAIAIRGGSAYNLLPILKNGRPACPIAIRKETGLSSSSPARPTQIAFNSTSDRIFALDHGTATLSVFAAQPEFPLLARLRFPSGINPTRFVMSSDERLLCATNPYSSSLHLLHYDPDTHALQASQLALPSGGHGTADDRFALHVPTGALLTAGNNILCAFEFNPHAASFKLRQTINLPHRAVRELIVPTGGEAVVALTDNGILRLAIDRHLGTLGPPEVVGPVASAMAFL